MKQVTVVADIETSIDVFTKILELMRENEINIRTINAERGNLSEIRMIVSEPERAVEILRDREYTAHTGEVVVVELIDRPGQLSKIANMLKENQINIDYIYAVDNALGEKGLFAVKTTTTADNLRELLSDFTTY